MRSLQAAEWIAYSVTVHPHDTIGSLSRSDRIGGHMASVFRTDGVTREDEELRKLQVETYKLLVEALKVNQERRWHPIMMTTGFFAAGAAFTAAFIKIMEVMLKG
jgi:hypothetical protein